MPEAPLRSLLIYPETGLYCIFDGKLAHGVLESCSTQDRSTLLVNWWRHQPQVCPDMATDLDTLRKCPSPFPDLPVDACL